MARSPTDLKSQKTSAADFPSLQNNSSSYLFWIVSSKVNQHRNSELERYTAEEMQVRTQVQNWFCNWLLVSQSNLEGTGSSSVTLEQATTAKASMMLSPDLQVLSMCQDRASHLPSSTGGRLPLKNGTKARNTTCRHTHTLSLRGGLITQPTLTSVSTPALLPDWYYRYLPPHQACSVGPITMQKR